MTGRLLIPGIEKDFGGGRVYVIPPLSLGALELLQDRMAELPSLTSTDPAAIKTIIDATHMALKRNYPELTREEVGELVDVGNTGEVYECLMDVAGIKRKAQEAERGNAQAKSPLLGPGSSPSSVPTPDGLGITSAAT